MHSLQNTAGDTKGALVFDDDGVRVLVFDRHWLTPDVQYSSLETDGFDWIAEFETEPNLSPPPIYGFTFWSDSLRFHKV